MLGGIKMKIPVKKLQQIKRNIIVDIESIVRKFNMERKDAEAYMKKNEDIPDLQGYWSGYRDGVVFCIAELFKHIQRVRKDYGVDNENN